MYPLVLRVAMPDRRGRSYREWSSNESESDDSESDHANESLPQPSRARTLAVEPSPFTVALSQEVVPFAIDVSPPSQLTAHSPHVVIFSCFLPFKKNLFMRAFELSVLMISLMMHLRWPSASTNRSKTARLAFISHSRPLAPSLMCRTESPFCSAILMSIRTSRTGNFISSFCNN